VGLNIEVAPDGSLGDRAIAAIAKYFAKNTAIGARPSYAPADLTATYDRALFNGESPSLLTAREKIVRAQAGIADCNVVFIGDSLTEGAGVQPFAGMQSYPAQLRRILGAVEGFVPATSAAWDDRWTVAGMSVPTDRSRIGLIPTTAGDPGVKSAQIVTSDPHTAATFHVRAPAGATVTLTVDGTTSNVTLTAQAGWQAVPATGLSNATHTLKVSSTADIEVLGVTLGYPTPRLKITRAARSGSNAADWLPDAVYENWASVITGPATTPDVIIANIGTNDPGVTANITALYASLAGLGIPVIATVPGGLGGYQAHSVYEPAFAAIYQAAQTHDMPLIDLEQVIGDYATAAAALLMDDNIHENRRGYLLEALALFTLLVG
jgi:hypothetical protein